MEQKRSHFIVTYLTLMERRAAKTFTFYSTYLSLQEQKRSHFILTYLKLRERRAAKTFTFYSNLRIYHYRSKNVHIL